MPLRRMKNSGRKAERVKKQKRPKRQEVSASSPTAASHREELRAKAAKYYQGPKVRTINQIREGLKPDSGAQDSHFFATSNKTPKMAPQHATKTVKSNSAKGQARGKGKITKKFVINASQPASDKIFDVSAFEKFLHDKIKVEGRVGNLGDVVQISQVGDGKIEVVTHIEFSGRYLKYLTKKYLKKQQLRDWLRVVSTSKGVYELRFFNVVNDDAEEEDD